MRTSALKRVLSVVLGIDRCRCAAEKMTTSPHSTTMGSPALHQKKHQKRHREWGGQELEKRSEWLGEPLRGVVTAGEMKR